MKIKIAVLLILTVFLTGTRAICAEDLTILTEEWPPVSFSAPDGPAGLGVDVVREILRRVKREDNIAVVPWARGWKMVTEYPNVILFTMTRTPEREKLVTMIGPVAIGTINFYAKKGSGIRIKTLADAKKVNSIGVSRAAVEEQILTKEGFTNLEATHNPLFSAKKLMKGRIDIWCNANLVAGKILEEAGYSLNDVENVHTLRENHLYIAMSKGTSGDVIVKWLDALTKMKKDGTFTRIYNRWLPGETPPEKTERIGISG
ncbi:amino acid ABC transporter substrate-binding pro tein [Desulfonema ishimotonii]|uniref:Amino acid ABC transporter substrate-binding pro tein n=1 Tax=Desulfonema ishimotonii TaxID=45657 RepID=A0A401G3Y2_9BACT|nr:transporter substrate-binding domain-containing protein [Desulfonema ishimotonii]GBC63940.1 amino acid ABC transporter substrate-binding pro tein [Desulfonema ishimotonii]